MRVLALVPHQTGFAPGQRGSIELWEDVLAKAGISLDFEPFESERLHGFLYAQGRQFEKAAEMVKGYLRRFELLGRLDDYDAVVVYREAALLGPAVIERLIARRKPVIYLLDDPLFMPYRSPSNGYLSYLKFFGKIKNIIRLSSVVIANSSHIEEYARRFNPNVWRIPSLVDTSKFAYRPPADDGKVCVGWSGSPTTVGNLKLIEGPLRELSESGECELKFIGGTDFGLEGVDYSAQEWRGETEVEDLRQIQIGLVPLPENSWNRYKFIMKTAQYMSLGIVPVATPIASNPEVVRHGLNGFLASNDGEWTEYLNLLVRDRDLRERLSSEAVKDALAKYSLAANEDKIVDAFRAALSQKARV